jgi:uncharacterized protein
MINLIPLDELFSIYQIPNNQEIPSAIISSGFYSITKTEDEISIVTNCRTEFGFTHSGKKWKGLKVEGILDFSLTGIINEITKPLKENKIPVFVLSTFNTDYVFVQKENFEKAIQILNLTENITVKE